MKTWTQEETNVLIEKYESSTNSELKSLFPKKSLLSVYKKAYKLGFRKNKEIEFKNRSEAKAGKNSYNWNGGKSTSAHGYVLIKCSLHPRADSKGYVLEHILVWEHETGITVEKGLCIHHLNGIKNDNRIENLCLRKFGAHTVYHHLGKKYSEESKKMSDKRRKSNVE